ncbi:MAG: hypothetical protein ABF806_01800 [Bifidobacterium psychraerophilum]|uniref:hypothetical protein n=1 Tax=Bifidobacterium psychraerophilum TaxID=218140 RepID=UPI0039E8E4CD
MSTSTPNHEPDKQYISLKKPVAVLSGIIALVVTLAAISGAYSIGRNQSIEANVAAQAAAKHTEFTKISNEVKDKHSDLDAANRTIAEADTTKAGIADLQKQHDDLERQVKDKQSELDGLTQKVDAAKKASISDGTWQVGTDIDPGTYRANSEVPSDCYWEVLSGDNIVKNDLPGGGFPQTTVSAGQQLKLSSCGTWTKQ